MSSASITTELSWQNLAEAKASCEALSASSEKANALTHLSLETVLGLNGCQPVGEQQQDIDYVLKTVKHLPNLVELTLKDSPYTWIPQNWLEAKLEKLVVHDPDEAVEALTASQPSIRHLEFWSLQSPLELPGTAPPHIIPALEHVAGYPAVVKHFVPGRPVHTIRASMISYIEPIEVILDTAQKSTAKVTTLDVAVREEERPRAVADIMATLGNSLTSLTVRYHKGKRIDSAEAFSVLKDDWTSGLSKATALHSFFPLMWTSDYQIDGSSVAQRLGQVCGTLRTVQAGKTQWALGAQGWAQKA